MKKNYRLFRIFCLTSIAILGLLLLSVGLLTAKYETDEAVFKATYSTVRIFSGENNVTVNLGGKILNFVPSRLISIFEALRPLILAPINNFLELVKAIISQLV